MRNRARAGLTLMEVLVAIALLSLLSVGILMALRVGAGAWERTNRNLMLDRRVATANSIFYAALEGVIPAPGEFVRPPVTTPMAFTFFQGEPDSMRFVTAYSLERGPRGGLRMMELRALDGPRGRRVLLNEDGWGGPRSTIPLVTGSTAGVRPGETRLLFAPIEPRPTSFIIADELAGCSFSYFAQDLPTEPGRWQAFWSRPEELPKAVSVQISARTDSARLRPVTVTVPIRATMRP